MHESTRSSADLTGAAPTRGTRSRAFARGLEWLAISGLVYLLLVAVGLMSSGFAMAAGDEAQRVFSFARNPVLALMAGTVATALVQSSSTVTSVIVGLVAGGLPISMAVPMIMGANVGTTITNTLVSIGHVRASDEFRRAFAAGTVHDLFNVLCVVVFLPLELSTRVLERSALFLSELLVGEASVGAGGFNVVRAATAPTVDAVVSSFEPLPSVLGGVLVLALGIGLLLATIGSMSRLLRSVMVGRAQTILHSAIGRGPWTGVASGTAVTALVQSSSTTTSLIVPLAGTGLLSLRDIYPFTLGANIGTTITALLAATAVTGPFSGLALQIALVHFLFNGLGVAVIYSIPMLRGIPLRAAENLAEQAVKHRSVAALYLLGVFFGIPGLLLVLSTFL